MSSLSTIASYGAQIDESAKAFLARNPGDLYGMLQYFMGYTDTQFVAMPTVAGKRIRPGLALYLAEAYGDLEIAKSAALSIELFHNFSLIHDDIEDHDELRRGRETVWKVWGINKALNAGDAQLLLSLLALNNTQESIDTAPASSTVMQFLLTQYLKVIEGQHQDFSLAELPLTHAHVTTSAYLHMIGNKSAELICAATAVGGLLAGAPSEDIEKLRVFGFELGLAYQLHDDYQSIWGSKAETGKTPMGDVVERKKTLPIIFTRDVLAGRDAVEFTKMFELHSGAGPEAIRLVLEKAGAREYLLGTVRVHAEACLESLESLSIESTRKTILSEFVRELIPAK